MFLFAFSIFFLFEITIDSIDRSRLSARGLKTIAKRHWDKGGNTGIRQTWGNRWPKDAENIRSLSWCWTSVFKYVYIHGIFFVTLKLLISIIVTLAMAFMITSIFVDVNEHSIWASWLPSRIANTDLENTQTIRTARITFRTGNRVVLLTRCWPQHFPFVSYSMFP